MKTWIFQGNPDKFDVDEYLRKSTEIYWSVTIPKHQREVAVGDEVYIWRARGSRDAIPGVVAFGVVNEECKPRENVLNPLNLYDDLWAKPYSEASGIKAGVAIKQVRLAPDDGMLTAQALKNDVLLSKMQILTARVGSNFLLSDAQRQILKTYWEALDLGNKDEDDEFLGSNEGRVKLRYHKVRERDPKLRRKAIELFRKRHGRLFCEVCEFSFEDRYGDIGKGFIEVHHLKPIAQYATDERTVVSNLKLVCSNCHRMIHRGDPLTTFVALQERLLPKHA